MLGGHGVCPKVWYRKYGMKVELNRKSLRAKILDTVEHLSGQDVRNCYQCGKCSAGCPMAQDMDYLPSQVIRMLQIGMDDEVLASRAIWLCASCHTCSTRCPREVALAEVMDALRIILRRRKLKSAEGRHMRLFNTIFLNSVRDHGRVFETAMVGAFNAFSFQPFKDIMKGPKLFFKGKLKLIPGRASVKETRAIYRRIEDMRERDDAGADAEEKKK